MTIDKVIDTIEINATIKLVTAENLMKYLQNKIEKGYDELSLSYHVKSKGSGEVSMKNTYINNLRLQIRDDQYFLKTVIDTYEKRTGKRRSSGGRHNVEVPDL